jgi:MFS family permease
MPFVWYIGTVIGPSIGGTFADPHESFPNLFPEGSLFFRFPYLLPNMICAGLLLASVIMGYLLLEETHPDLCHRDDCLEETPCHDSLEPRATEETPLHETSDAMKMPAVDLRSETYGTFVSREGTGETFVDESKTPKTYSIWDLDHKIMALVLALSIFTYHSMTFDHLLPIYFEDKRTDVISSMANALPGFFFSSGGLGLSVRAVGLIMAINGVIALFVQAVIFPLVAERFGVYRLYILVTVLHPIAYLIMPLLPHVPEPLLYPAIYACLTVRNILSIIVYPLLLIMIKEATPSNNALGLVNGLAASAGAACRMVAPPVAGYLYTLGSKIDCTAMAWWGSAIVAAIGAFQCFSVSRPRSSIDEEEEQAFVGGH